MVRKLTLTVTLFITFTMLVQAGSVPLDIYSEGEAESDMDGYGTQVLFLPDYDGDSVYDLAVSSPGNETMGEQAGAVYIFLGPVPEDTDLSPSAADIVLTGDRLDDFGRSMDAGDFNGDGTTDILVGAPGESTITGRAYIFHGGNVTNRSAREANATFEGPRNWEKFGWSVAGLGDMNGDGFDDFSIGTGRGRWTYVYHGSEVLETPEIMLPEVSQDQPPPVDFTNGLNSTGNSFGLGNTTDGWDWKQDIYGGTNPDISFNPLVNQGGTNTFLEMEMGNTTDGDGDVPAASGGYGVEFDLDEEVVRATRYGGELRLELTWTTMDAARSGTGFEYWHDEVYWVKCRFWNSSTNATYLGWNRDGDTDPGDDEANDATTDSTAELFYVDWSSASGSTVTYRDSESIDVTDLMDGAHTYYLDAGGKLSDWSTTGERLLVRIDDVDLEVKYPPIAEILAPAENEDHGVEVAGPGDVNGDGYADLLVGYPFLSEARVYFGGPDFSADFDLTEGWAIPSGQGTNDTTQEVDVEDLQSNDGGWGGSGYYQVRRNEVMWVDKWDTGDLRGQVIEAYLYLQYNGGWGYDGTNWVRWSMEGEDLQRTDLQPTSTNGDTSNYGFNDPPYPLHENGLKNISQLRGLNLEFTNNDGGGMGNSNVMFDYALIYTICQMAANVTITGPVASSFGEAISGIGNINGDNCDDLVIGAPYFDNEKGAAYIFTGGLGFTDNLTHEDALTSYHGHSDEDHLGKSVAGIGEFSLDEIPDVALGSEANDNGTIYIMRGGPKMPEGDIEEVAQYSMVGERSGSLFSAAMDGIGDINDRHAGEILVGAPAWPMTEGGTPAGKAYILYNTDEDILDDPLIIDFIPDEDPTIYEGEEQEFGVKVRAPEELRIGYNWFLDGKAVSRRNASYTFEAGYGSAGTYDVKVSVSDGFRTEGASWTLQVLDVNGPPWAEFYPDDDPVIDEGDSVRFWLKAGDPDDDLLYINWSFDGQGMASDEQELTVGPEMATVGDHDIHVTVSDGEFEVEHRWGLTVVDVNLPPVIDWSSPDGEPTVRVGTDQDFEIRAHDPDGDDLTVVWFMDGEAVKTGTFKMGIEPGTDDIGDHVVKVLVSDGELWAQRIWDLTVIEKGPEPPVIDWYTPSSPVFLNEGEDMVFWISPSDPDGDDLSITWYLDGKEVGKDNKSHHFEVPFEPSGHYQLRASVGDGLFEISVNWSIIVNRGPSIKGTSTVPENAPPIGGEIVMRADVHDPDGDELDVSWFVNDDLVEMERLPGSDKPSETDIHLVVTSEFSSEMEIRAQVTDGELTDSGTWYLNLTPPDSGPPTAIISMTPEGPEKGDEISFDSSASTDPDGDIVSRRWTFDDGQEDHGENITRSFEERGVHTVTLTVEDAQGNMDTARRTVIIGGHKSKDKAEDPWGILLFLILMVLFVILLFLQARRKGWIASGEGYAGRGDTHRTERRDRVPDHGNGEERHEDLGEEEGEEPDDLVMEDEDTEIEGGFEEIPLEEEEL